MVSRYHGKTLQPQTIILGSIIAVCFHSLSRQKRNEFSHNTKSNQEYAELCVLQKLRCLNNDVFNNCCRSIIHGLHTRYMTLHASHMVCTCRVIGNLLSTHEVTTQARVKEVKEFGSTQKI